MDHPAPPDLISQKRDLRKTLLLQRENFPLELRHVKSTEIGHRLFETASFNQAKTIQFYLAMPDEVQTLAMIRQAQMANKKIAAPVIRKEMDCLSFFQLTETDPLVIGRYGICEPPSNRLREIVPQEIDLWILPGVAFDRNGNRLGLGGGYYDRALERVTAPLIGLAFEFQVVDAVPISLTDRRMDQIITETETIYCKGAPLKTVAGVCPPYDAAIGSRSRFLEVPKG